MQPRIAGPGFAERVYACVRTVPAGRVTTYGDVAEELGSRSVARHVGFALAALLPKHGDVPWHRVVNAGGRVSFRSDGRRSDRQIARLGAEGVEIGPGGRVAAFAAHRYVYQ